MTDQDLGFMDRYHIAQPGYDLQQVFLRGCFLSERTEPGGAPTTDQAEKLAALKAQYAESSDYVRGYIDQLEDQLHRLPTALQQSEHMPEWYIFLLKAIDFSDATDGLGLDAEPDDQIPFYPALRGFVGQCIRGAIHALSAHGLQASPSVIAAAKKAVASDLLKMCGITLYSEYHDAHNNPTGGGATTAAYALWCDRLASSDWRQLAVEYPVLLRLMFEKQRRFADFFVELLVRLEADSERITAKFDIDTINVTLSDIEFGLSDSHNDGRTVCRLIFNNGSRLIYKPKSLATERWFFDFLQPKLLALGFPVGAIRILDRGKYGWAEDITLATKAIDATPTEVRIGRIAALFYMLNATDMHCDNIVLLNGRIYPVDLETLFNALPENEDSQAAWRHWSILSTDLLRTHFGRASYNRDPSGFFADDVAAPFKTFVLSCCSREGVRLELREPSSDIPNANTAETTLELNEVVAAFVAGVKDLGGVLNPDDFCADNLLQRCTTRFVFRPTMFYSRLFQRLYQPRLLRDGATFSLDLTGLMISLKQADNRTATLIGPIVADEILQIQNGDIPYFWLFANGLDLMSRNDVVKHGFLTQSGLEVFADKLSGIEGADISEQTILIEASFAMARFSWNQPARALSGTTAPDLAPLEVLSICQNLARTIISGATRPNGSPARWIGYIGDASGEEMIPIAGEDSFYGGYWGIMLFLIATQRVATRQSKEDPLLEEFLAIEAAFWQERIRRMLSHERRQVSGSLGLGGIGGEILCWSLIHALDQKGWKRLSDLAIAACRTLPTKEVVGGLSFDVIGGQAGLVLALCALAENQNEKTHDLIGQYGNVAINTLLRNAQPQMVGVGWSTLIEPKCLLGFAHGGAGIITALQMALDRPNLFKLDAPNSDRVREVVAGAVAYQDSKVDLNGAWLDLRKRLPLGTPLNDTWCHGLAGIGISQLALMSGSLRREAATDIERTCALLESKSSPQIFDCYCCGECGEIDFLLEAARATGSPLLMRSALAKMNTILGELQSTGGFKGFMGLTRPTLFAGLFQGASGIGYTALRFIDEGLPSLSGYRAQMDRSL